MKLFFISGACLLLGVIVGGWCCREIDRLLWAGYYQDIGKQTQDFDRFVLTWNTYVKRSDGFLTADPYRGLIDSGTFASYAELRGVVFNACLPPRINPQLSQNAKRVILWEDRKDLEEIWNVYADGTWARVAYRKDTYENWCQYCKDAGYPRWATLKDKDEWTAANRNRLVWDPAIRMYRVIVAQTQPVTPAKSACR